MRLAIPSDSLESQYAVTVYGWPAKTLSFAAMDRTCSSDRVLSASFASALAAASLADVMSFSKESASCRALLARVRALDDAVCALFALSSAFPSESAAFPASVRASLAWDSAVEESEMAVLASRSASSALLPREPITFPDSSLVRTKQMSAADNAATSRTVENL